MGLLDLIKPRKADVTVTRSALEEARDPNGDHGGAIGQLVERLLHVGIDGAASFKGAAAVADKAGSKKADAEQAIADVVAQHVKTGAVGGFLTSLGGFITMPVAIPVNVLEFYLQATRMTASIAKLRGYDIDDPQIRTAVLLTLTGSKADDILAKAGLSSVVGGTVNALARKNLPASALMLINKAVGFRLLKSVGTKALSKFGRAIPLLGGGVGAALDGFMMNKIAEAAKREFPAITRSSLDL